VARVQPPGDRAAALWKTPTAIAAAASSPWNRLLWFGLSASASVLLLAVTNHLTQDIAAIPFLWIAPLSAYLLSFILCFEAPRIYHRAVFLPLTAAALGFMTYQMWPEHRIIEMRPPSSCWWSRSLSAAWRVTASWRGSNPRHEASRASTSWSHWAAPWAVCS
jgi:hypothetical protein